MVCKRPDWHRVDGKYICNGCGSTEFYDVTQPARHETDDGAWVYVPRFSARSASDPSPSPKSQHDAGSTHGSPHGTKQAINPEPSDPPDWFYEGAESETPTHDTLVDPDGSSRSSRRRRARRAAGRQPSGTPEVATGSAVDNKEQSAHVGTSSSELLTVMRQLLNEKKDTKSKDSNSTTSWMEGWNTTCSSHLEIQCVRFESIQSLGASCSGVAVTSQTLPVSKRCGIDSFHEPHWRSRTRGRTLGARTHGGIVSWKGLSLVQSFNGWY